MSTNLREKEKYISNLSNKNKTKEENDIKEIFTGRHSTNKFKTTIKELNQMMTFNFNTISQPVVILNEVHLMN